MRFGRPPKLTPQQAKLAKRLLHEGKLVKEIAETFGVHLATIYRFGSAEVTDSALRRSPEIQSQR